MIKAVVSDNQSAFILGRRISNNILLTHELMNNYHRDRGPPRCAFKVDIQKAYDTVDWRFLENILTYFGFPTLMVKWIIACVMSASFSLNVNGDIHGYFQGKRGLRQGDPISPYLFTLVMEVLTLIIKRRARVSNTFRYHKHCEELRIVNVCFADDLFLFVRGEVDSARLIMEALDEFQKSSGLVFSIPKSTTYFCNVHTHIKHDILNRMPFSEGELPVKYLGVPLISSRLLNKDCKILVERVTNRIGDWKNKSLFEAFFGVMASNNVVRQRWHGILFIFLNVKVRWIHCYKLRGRRIWDVPIKHDMSWGDIYSKGYNLQNCVVDLATNGGWSWPQAWLLKSPNIALVPAPNLVESRLDVPQWRDYGGKFSDFSAKCAWEAFRPRGNEDIVAHFQPMAHRRNVISIIGRLLVAAASYFIWVERNNRLFKNVRRSSDEIRDTIMITVR
ncbi:protein LAZ1 [Tanacetum coccineum]